MAWPTPEIQLNLLGRFEAHGPGVSAPLRPRKARALLTFLALTDPVPQPRERLTGLLWGSHFETQARQNLRHALVQLRRTLGAQRIVSEHDLVGLQQPVPASDARRFHELIDDGSNPALQAAVALYRGDLAADLAISEPAWEEWIGLERESLRARCIEALVVLGEQALGAGDPASALDHAGRALQLNEFREDAHRAWLAALAAMGRRCDALRHFERLSGRLARELAAAPEPATCDCVEQIRGGGMLPAPAASAPDAPASAAQPPSLAVQPFRALSADPEIGFAADALAHDLEVAFAKLGDLQVASYAPLSPGAADHVGGGPARPRELTYLLEGSVRPLEQAVRINVLLVHASSGLKIWAETFQPSIRGFLRGADATVRALVAAAHRRMLRHHEAAVIGEAEPTRPNLSA